MGFQIVSLNDESPFVWLILRLFFCDSKLKIIQIRNGLAVIGRSLIHAPTFIYVLYLNLMLLRLHLKMFWVHHVTRTRLYFAPPLLGHNSALLLWPPCAPPLASLLPIRFIVPPRMHSVHCSSAPRLQTIHIDHVDFGYQPSLPPLLGTRASTQL